MKLKALLLALFTAGFAVSIAVAASPAAVEKGKPTTSTGTTGTTTGTTSTDTTGTRKRGKSGERKPACTPARKIRLSGTYVAPAAGGFAMAITGGNRAARSLEGKQATVLTDGQTRVHGKKRTLASLAAGDRLQVQGYACKADAAAGTVLARKVAVKGPKGGGTGTTTGTTTTTTTTTGTTTGTTTSG